MKTEVIIWWNWY